MKLSEVARELGLPASNVTLYLNTLLSAGMVLRDPLIAAIGGSWLAKPDEIHNAEWATILARAKKATQLAAEA